MFHDRFPLIASIAVLFHLHPSLSPPFSPLLSSCSRPVHPSQPFITPSDPCPPTQPAKPIPNHWQNDLFFVCRKLKLCISSPCHWFSINPQCFQICFLISKSVDAAASPSGSGTQLWEEDAGNRERESAEPARRSHPPTLPMPPTSPPPLLFLSLLLLLLLLHLLLFRLLVCHAHSSSVSTTQPPFFTSSSCF